MFIITATFLEMMAIIDNVREKDVPSALPLMQTNEHSICKMSEQNIIRGYAQINVAIDYCIEQNLLMPALILIYSAIDSISWAASENRSVRIRFLTWVNKWMLKKYPLPCTAIELYAARCGIIHTLTPNSDLSENEGVRRISYAWSTAKQKDLEEAINLLKYPGIVGVHINDLSFSFRNGLYDFIDALEKDKKRKELFTQKAGKHFANLEPSIMSEFLVSTKKDGG